MFAEMLGIFFKDCIQTSSTCMSERWLNAMKQYDSQECVRLLSVCMKSKDKCTKSANIKLLADQMLIQMKEA